MQRNNAKDDAVEGGEDGERPPSSHPIAPAVGLSPPQPAGKSIAYFLRIADETRETVRATTVLSEEDEDCGFIFSALVKTHNDIINTIRDIPPWEWNGEFLRCEPELLHFLDQNRKRHPECPAFNQAHILASALSLYHRENQTPKPLTEQERAVCIAANRDLVDEYSNVLLHAYREIFNFLFEQGGNTAHTAVAEIIKVIVHEHEQTRQMIKETNGLVQKVLSAIASVISAVATAARQLIKSINMRNIDGLDITGPRSQECRDQVFAVVVFLANPKHPQSIHHACEQTFRVTEDGYENVERLYIWCYRNKSRIWAWVETYRLNHGID